MDRKTFINTDFEKIDKRQSVEMVLSMLMDLGGYYGSEQLTASNLGIDWNALREVRRLANEENPRMPAGEATLKIIGAWMRLYILKTNFDKKLCYIEKSTTTGECYVCEPGVVARPGQPIALAGEVGTYRRFPIGSTIFHTIDYNDPNVDPVGLDKPPTHVVIGRLAPLEESK